MKFECLTKFELVKRNQYRLHITGPVVFKISISHHIYNRIHRLMIPNDACKLTVSAVSFLPFCQSISLYSIL